MLDANDQLYDSANDIATCPTDWDADNPPTLAAPASPAAANSSLSWALPGADNGTRSVYGFRVTIGRLNAELTELEGAEVVDRVSAAWWNTVYRTYYAPGNAAFASGDAGISMAGATATLRLSPALPPGTYRIRVETVNLDGVSSTPASELRTIG